jgi:ATP-dependent DNA helicase RecG
MYLRGTIERMGSGTLDMVKRCKEMGLPLPVFVQEEDFRVIMHRTPQTTPQTTPQSTPQTTLETKILDLIKQDQSITQASIAEKLGISFYTVKEYLTKMKKKGHIQRKGGTFKGYWVIND